jgi:hypothetical protein
VSLLIGLLVLDLVGLIPGIAFVTSLLAAVVLLAIDARGLVTLNGLIKWNHMEARQKLVVGFLEVGLFQFLVLVYLAQRLFAMARHASRAVVVESASASPTDSDAIERALDRLLSEVKNGLPRDLLEKVRQVEAAVRDILPAFSRSDLEPRDRFAVERTVDDYLPSALQSYLRLPPAFRFVPLPEAGGRTASQVLSDQLDLLLQRMRQVTDAAYRNDVEALLVHGRFLQSKFGRSSLSLG